MSITVIDSNNQYSHLICKKIRKLNVRCNVICDMKNSKMSSDTIGIILLGENNNYVKESLEFNVPILGICNGMQILAKNDDNQVKDSISENKNCGLIFKNCDNKLNVWINHEQSTILNNYLIENDECDSLTISEIEQSDKSVKDLKVNNSHVKVKSSPIIAFKMGNIYGIQLYPKVFHSYNGMKILSNFIFDICKGKCNWNINVHLKKIQNDIIDKIGDDIVLMTISSKINSIVCATILNNILKYDDNNSV